MHCGYFDTTRKGNYSSFLTPTAVGGDTPFCLKFALKVTHPSKNADFDRLPLITKDRPKVGISVLAETVSNTESTIGLAAETEITPKATTDFQPKAESAC